MELFKTETYTKTELNIIAEALDNNVVKKYLNDQMVQAFSAIAEGEPGPEESAESYLRRQARVQGNIAAFKLLLSIKKPEAVEEQNPQ